MCSLERSTLTHHSIGYRYRRVPDPELWVQLDLRYPERLGWTISLTADGTVTLQFQYMKAPPFDTIEARKRLYDAVAALPGVNVEERLTGRPSFPIAALAVGENLEHFIKILEDAVDQMVGDYKRSKGSNESLIKPLGPGSSS